MKDSKTLAFINMYGIFGALPTLCELDADASRLIAGETVSIGFAVRGGPQAQLVFRDGGCELREGLDGCTIRLPFSSCEKFNGMIDGTVTPIPSKGLTRISFLLKKFTPLTDLLSRYLRPSEQDLANPVFFEKSTRLMLCVITGALAAIGNHDPIGRASASYIVDGAIRLEITGCTATAILAQDHRLRPVMQAPKECRSYMRFADLQVARALFDGKINAVVAVGLGQVRIGGMISQVDNINRILDRVAQYLA